MTKRFIISLLFIMPVVCFWGLLGGIAANIVTNILAVKILASIGGGTTWVMLSLLYVGVIPSINSQRSKEEDT